MSDQPTETRDAVKKGERVSYFVGEIIYMYMQTLSVYRCADAISGEKGVGEYYVHVGGQQHPHFYGNSRRTVSGLSGPASIRRSYLQSIEKTTPPSVARQFWSSRVSRSLPVSREK